MAASIGRTRLGALLLVLMLAFASCGQGDMMQGVSAQGQEQTVPLDVVHGPSGATLALVPVFIQGQGPFLFALDTGASQSLVDTELVQQFNLQTVGSTGQITGVTGATRATQIRVERWSVGRNVELPAATIITLDLPEENDRRGLRGLLGSDMLGNFGAITIDYEREVLVLRARR